MDLIGVGTVAQIAGPCSSPDAAERIRSKSLYAEGVEAHWRETTVGEHGKFVLEGLPFEPGQPVEVSVLSKAARLATAIDALQH